MTWLKTLLAPRFVRSRAVSEAESDNLHIYASKPDRPCVLITVIGVDDAHLDEIITVTTKKFGATHRVTYVTDSLDFMQFRNRQAVFEYLPSALEQTMHASEIDWGFYLERRWALLMSKWRPVHILSYGQNVEGFIASAPGLALGRR
ncbi:hypothetical protein [Rhizobium laguerreae]|uniref:hypothetical protein n=1 Tax=Rhizobium laguerreae TaxID=1076926 RepID=UPI001C927391|nr:hypothetical protein [Rhizobium laguerreae]MBY3348011.1 hypothetical protein [Rhizobium laguerreae]MBY3354974.1 hypothetical protein [Rhizobium laguerreae]MBY3376279.1 hypothetical protein [Rhizobium laguerreae]MBY3431278.1 hypothetical protein [Rhizobium laguerreae]MBY3482112.1 hypothetical protein [Rhizobium laguerreae]